MPLTTRAAVTSFDDVLAATELNVPDAASVVVSWSRSHQTAVVMGFRDEAGGTLDVSPDLLVRLTSMFARPVDSATISWAFPDVDVSGPVVLSVSVHEPVVLLFGQNVVEHVVNGLPVPEAVVRDALWMLLDSAGLPSASVRVLRTTMHPASPVEGVFVPAELRERADGSGAVVTWERALQELPAGGLMSGAIAALVNELAVRAERALSLQGVPRVLTDAVVPV